MNPLGIKFYSGFFAVILQFLLMAGYAQNRPQAITMLDFTSIENSISQKHQLLQIRQQLEVLKQQAIQSHDDITLARSLYNLMRIRDQRTEDTAYFRNSAFIDTLLRSTSASPKLKAILHLMQAQRIERFDYRPFRFNYAAYRTKDLNPDYAALTRTQRDSIVAQELDKALKFHDPKTKGSQLLWLSASPDIFLFEPTFEDIVLSEKINFQALKRSNDDEFNRSLKNRLSSSSNTFLSLLDSLAQRTKNHSNILVSYRDWIKFHKSDPAVSSFIESLARKSIYLSGEPDSLTKQAYITYLQQCIASPYPAVKAHGVYQLCLIWNEEGNKYINFGERYYYEPASRFNPQYQFYPKKALQLYTQHKTLLSTYPLFNQVLSSMAQQIQMAGIRIEMDDQHLPEKDIPIKVIYKNADSLFYRIVRISSNETAGSPTVHATSQLLSQQPVAMGAFALPLPDDHNRHAVYLKLNALPHGHYRLLFSNMPIKPDGYDLQNLPFEVTFIAAVNTDENVFVLNRKTGFPLPGANIKAFYKKLPVSLNSKNSIHQNGAISFAENMVDSISIAYQGDTTGYRFSAHKNNLGDAIYNPDEDGELGEFYTEKLRMEIFTDRSIYRPGQTVYYKIILLTNDPNTGSPILFNNQILGGAPKILLQNWLNDAKNKITLIDPFSKEIDSAVLKINDFGSFAGSFVIPKTAATGRWRIDGSDHTDYQNRGEFKVEEYKRPSIELSMEKQKKMLLPGQPFTVKLKLRSFSGASLDNTPITYVVNRYGYIPTGKTKPNNFYNHYTTTTLIKQAGHTNEQGELLVYVSDTVLVKLNLDDNQILNYNYSISATAVDATGESTTIDETVNVSTHPIKINIPIDKIYDRNRLSTLQVSAQADFEGLTGQKVDLKLYKISNPGQQAIQLKQVDQWYYKVADWNTWFPDQAVGRPASNEKILILDTTVNTADYGKLALPREKITVGFYQLLASVKSNGRTIGRSSYNFNVFDSKTGEVPVDDIDYLPSDRNTQKPGSVLTWYSSSKAKGYTIYQIMYVAGKHKRIVKNIYQTVTEEPGIRVWKYRIPQDVIGYLILTRITVNNNHIFKHEKRVQVSMAVQRTPEIIIEKYRKVMVPGTQETFKLSIKTQNDNIAAELLTTLYDSSLDKLDQHQWNLPPTPQQSYLYTDWNYTLTHTRRAGNYTDEAQRIVLRELSEKSAQAYNVNVRVAGLSITEASGANEIFVVGYGTQRKSSVTGAVTSITIRGNSSIADYKQPLIILDGQIFNGNLNSINSSAITQVMVLKGADAAAIYGARAAQGVLIISTKGPIVLPGNEEPIIKVRKNFNETAFFYPQVHADKDGYYSFSFTMPETATEWNWKMLAHTRNAQFAYLERKLQTQLNLMVQPNMPRLLYQGDRITLKTRISNLDTLSIQGKATCKIEDAVTGEDITSLLVTNTAQAFSLNRKSTGTVTFSLKVPVQLIHPLKIVIAATNGNMADAEEHVLPVLSSRVFIRQSQPVHFTGNPTLNVSPVKLPADANLFGVSLSIAQKPQSSLIYALPWLASYSYDCAEQTFNKLRAQVTALQLMQKDTATQNAFKQVAASTKINQSDTSSLPDELADQTMPWLGMSTQTAHQQKQLYHLLDTSVTKNGIIKHLEKLYTLQQPDGGLAWFDGGRSNNYISAYVLAGFGQLKQQGWLPDRQQNVQQKQFIEHLFTYQQDMLSLSKQNLYSSLFAMYAMSYWVNEQPLSGQLSAKINQILSACWQRANISTLEQQALLIITTLRFTDNANELNQKARRQLENIKQLAIQDNQNGLRWKDIADAEELNSSAEETMALLAEAFEVSGTYHDVRAGIVKWLLATKQDEHWQTTKATAAAVNMLRKEKTSTLGETKSVSTTIAGQQLSVSDGILDGQHTAFTPIKQLPNSISLQTTGNNTKGALTWYYFATPEKLDTLNKAVKISKRFYRNDSEKGWVAFAPHTVLKAGDRVQVKLMIETASRLKFVHINEPRAAAFEPKETHSGYQYTGGLAYYQSIRDTGLDLFTEDLPRGISEISYELIVAHNGDFTSGPTVLQCMYKPTVTAYSNTQTIKVE